MARETGEHETIARTPTTDDVFEALATSPRRQLLLALEDANSHADSSFDPTNLLADGDELAIADSTQIELVHVHLPKLDNQGFVDWNRDTGTIETGPEWGTIEPVLSVIREHRDEFPGGLL
ncbi:hypothetical protein [Haloferax sp. YSSS75]|uniref:DUF7344 domain-containing protein n=1 Tax=Haloferax sp. YSSS75 TaxID=3388564 RepID=UPI00398C8D9A